jgi:hypothetical protein
VFGPEGFRTSHRRSLSPAPTSASCARCRCPTGFSDRPLVLRQRSARLALHVRRQRPLPVCGHVQVLRPGLPALGRQLLRRLESRIRFLFVDYRKNDTNWKGHFFDALGDRTLAQHGVVASSTLLGASRPARSCVASIARGEGGGHLASAFIESGPDAGELGTTARDARHAARGARHAGHALGTRRAALGTRHSALGGFNAGLRVELVDAASTLSRARIPPGQINDRAGVVSADWLAGYDRLDPDRRFETARALRFG